MIEVKPVGWIKSSRLEAIDDDWGNVISYVELDPQQFSADALAGLETFSHIEVVYHFHKVSPDNVMVGCAHPRENPLTITHNLR